MNLNVSRKKPGQSLPLIAFMIVVIIAMVGLSVDVGTAYGKQRQLQNSANAAALSGMSMTMGQRTNQEVWDSIKRSLAANRIDTASTRYRYKADYIFATAKPQLIGQWNMVGSEGMEIVPNANMTRPLNVIRIQVTLEEVFDTYFARVVGRPTLPVNVNGNACPGGYGIGVYPIGVPRMLVKGYHRIYSSRNPNTPLATNTEPWNSVASGEWDKPAYSNAPTMVGMIVELPIENQGGGTPPGTHIGWLNWNYKSNSNSAQALGTSMTYPGDLQDGFREGPIGDYSVQNNTPNGRLELLDWVDGSTGVKGSNDVDTQLNYLAQQRHVMILPMWSKTTTVNGKSTFYITKMGQFQMIEYGRTGNPKYLRLMYLGDAPGGADGCAKEVPDGTKLCPPNNPNCAPATEKTFGVSGTARVNRVWRTNKPNAASNDIVIVMDESGSMNYDWTDQVTNVVANRRITAARTAVKNFLRNYDLKDDPEARIAFVKFGGTSATRVADWSTACSASQIANECGGPGNKWPTIQQAVDSLNPRGATPGPYGFERAMQQLQTAQTTRASGRPVRKVVIFVTDGVFNICGSIPNTRACPAGQSPPCSLSPSTRCTNSADYNLVEPRPVWQGQQRAAEIKATGASIFTIALKGPCPAGSTECFDPKGLPEMSSGAGYHYEVDDGNALNNIFQLILAKIDNDACLPKEQVDLAPGAKLTLLSPSNPSFKRTTTADGEGRWQFSDLPAGQYVVKADAYSLRSPEDGLTRLYSRVRNALDLGEEGQVSFSLNPQWPQGSVVYGEVLLSLPTDSEGVPLNGCRAP